jgi:hypothetical protein
VKRRYRSIPSKHEEEEEEEEEEDLVLKGWVCGFSAEA